MRPRRVKHELYEVEVLGEPSELIADTDGCSVRDLLAIPSPPGSVIVQSEYNNRRAAFDEPVPVVETSLTSTVSYACDPSQRYCECGNCAAPKTHDVKFAALAEYNRASNATVHFLILLMALLAFMAIGAWNTEQNHRAIVQARTT